MADDTSLEASGDPAQVQALKNTIRAIKGHLTCYINSANRAVEGAGARPSSHSMAVISDLLGKIRAQMERLERSP